MSGSRYKSIMTLNDDRCFWCNKYGPVEWHHIFGGADRDNSTKYGLVVPLCHSCHNEPPNGMHFNEENNKELKKRGQRVFECLWGHDRFIEIFQENYLDDED